MEILENTLKYYLLPNSISVRGEARLGVLRSWLLGFYYAVVSCIMELISHEGPARGPP